VTAPAEDRTDLPPPTLEEVGDGTWAYVQLDGSWGLNNAGVLAGS
jgi:cyclase